MPGASAPPAKAVPVVATVLFEYEIEFWRFDCDRSPGDRRSPGTVNL